MRDQRANLPYIITYVIAILLILTGAVFYRQPLLSVLFLLLLLLPVLSIGILRAVFPKIVLSVALPGEEGISRGESGGDEVRAGESFTLRLIVENPTAFPMLHLKLSFSYQNRFMPRNETNELVLPARARGKETLLLDFAAEDAGLFEFRADSFSATDYLHLFTIYRAFDAAAPRKRGNGLPRGKLGGGAEKLSARIVVLPKEVRLREFQFERTAVEAEEEILSDKGEPSRDIRSFREYREGDRLRDIAWKQTARTGELTVREFEREKELYLTLLPELSVNTLQETLAVFFGLGERLVKAEEPFRAAIYHPADGTFRFPKVGSREELLAALGELYLQPVEEKSTAYEALLRTYPELTDITRIAGGEGWIIGLPRDESGSREG